MRLSTIKKTIHGILFGALTLLSMRISYVRAVDAFPDGVWTTRGAGYVFDVKDGMVSPKEETAISCVPNDDLLIAIKDIQIDGDVANITPFRYAGHYVCDRTDSFQAGCANGTMPVIGDAEYVFDALVAFDILDQTFVENYPFFELHGIDDWDGSTSEARATLTSNSTQDELLDAFKMILEPIDDYHVWVKTNPAEDEGYFPSPMRIQVQFQEEFEQQDAISDFDTYYDTQIQTWLDIVDGYMGGGLNYESGGLLFWGRFEDTNIGYMNLREVPDPDLVGGFVEEMDAAFLALTDSDVMVLDIRVNQGGSDVGALFVASYFASTPLLAFTKQPIGGDSIEVYVEPGDPAYRHNGELIVIVSRSSYSAAETMPLALVQLPQTTLLGRNTGGAFTELPKILLNGWAFSMNNEVYTSPDGMVYEKVGIPPDIEPDAELLPLSEREQGIDSWLELALKTAQEITTTSDAVKVFMSYGTWTPLWVMCWAIF